MPHIHMLLILDKNAKILSGEEVDEYVSARIPPLPPMDDLSPAANQARRLHYYVTQFMTHDCNKSCLIQRDSNVGNDEQNYTSCKKHFPKRYSDHTVISG